MVIVSLVGVRYVHPTYRLIDPRTISHLFTWERTHCRNRPPPRWRRPAPDPDPGITATGHGNDWYRGVTDQYDGNHLRCSDVDLF